MTLKGDIKEQQWCKKNSTTTRANRVNGIPQQTTVFWEANLALNCSCDIVLPSERRQLTYNRSCKKKKMEWECGLFWLHNFRLQFLSLSKRKVKPRFFLTRKFNCYLHAVYSVKREDSAEDNIYIFLESIWINHYIATILNLLMSSIYITSTFYPCYQSLQS